MPNNFYPILSIINQKLFLVGSRAATLVIMRVCGGNIQISPLVTYETNPLRSNWVGFVSEISVMINVSVARNSIAVSTTEDYSSTVIRWPWQS